jgi:dihydrofolate reductase
MGRLIYSGNISLDGYMNDANGNFDWGEPTDEIHQFWNDLDRPIGTHIYGRKLYETMVVWETMPPTSPVTDDYADVWRNSDKLVISHSLPSVTSTRTTLRHSLDLDWLAEFKASSAQDITIGGPTLAAQAFDLVDEIHVLLYPVVVGGGTRFFPDGASALFTLAESRVFGNGVVHVHYGATGRD